MRTIKANSSKWFKTKNPLMEWQVGYAAFGVSNTNIPAVEEDIHNQKEHHRKINFTEEMSLYLGKLGEEKVYREWFDATD